MPDGQRELELRGPLDLVTTLAPLVHGRGDRTIRLRRDEAWIGLRTRVGPASLRIVHLGPLRVRADAWGDGAQVALDLAAGLIGELDEPERLIAHHPVIRRIQRTHPGLRLPRAGGVLHALVPAILEQKVTGTEAFRAYAALQCAVADRAPGPASELGLVLPPEPARLAAMPYHAFHPFGVERRRADVIRRAASVATWLEASADAADAGRRLRSLSGVGPWTTAEVLRSAFGDPDAVSIGDFHIPNTVAWALAGEPRGTDERMLELLEPYRGQRGRVQRLLEVARITAPRFGPRLAPRRIEAI